MRVAPDGAVTVCAACVQSVARVSEMFCTVPSSLLPSVQAIRHVTVGIDPTEDADSLYQQDTS